MKDRTTLIASLLELSTQLYRSAERERSMIHAEEWEQGDEAFQFLAEIDFFALDVAGPATSRISRPGGALREDQLAGLVRTPFNKPEFRLWLEENRQRCPRLVGHAMALEALRLQVLADLEESG